MVVTSRSSLRSSVRPRQPAEKKTKNTRARQHASSQPVDDDSDHDVLSHPEPISESKTLSNVAHPQENLRKRPRASPPSPTRSRRLRAPLAVHQPAYDDDDIADDHLDHGHRPVKKPRREPVTPSAKIPLHSRDSHSPDPLNTIDGPDHHDSSRRPNTFSSPTPVAAVSSSSKRRSARTGQSRPVVIVNDGESHGVTASTGPEAQGNSTHKDAAGQNEKSAAGAAPQPAPVPERRSLRSHDGGSRTKSELALYFPNYEQMISLEPPKPEFLAPDTTVVLLDDLAEPPLPPSPASPSKSRKPKSDSDSPFGNPLVNLHACEVVELPEPADPTSQTDPLGEEVYFKAHRRNERQEKQLRNIEKERAQHEKVQLDRLLDELQGHDWLRVMGISGITDTEKKLYEPKRDLFIKEVAALIEKFRVWKEEEKRRKQEREQMLAAAAAAAAAASALSAKEEKTQRGEEADAGEAEEENDDEGEEQEEAEEEAAEDVRPPSSDLQSYGDPPDPNDVDAWAARQLLQEARSASAAPKPSQPPPPPAVPEPEPFRSFFAKRYLRDAAIGGHRRGRSRMAFGQPIPEMQEREFQLPDDILTPEAISSVMRKRRRLKRASR
ncbi:hypothetical protein VTN96DRAFT_5829 [Rasamsonia emersonii]